MTWKPESSQMVKGVGLYIATVTMDVQSALHQLDNERRTLVRDGESIEIGENVTRLRSFDGSRHTIVFSSLTAENAEEVIAGELEHFRSIGGEVEWKVYGHGAP